MSGSLIENNISRWKESAGLYFNNDLSQKVLQNKDQLIHHAQDVSVGKDVDVKVTNLTAAKQQLKMSIVGSNEEYLSMSPDTILALRDFWQSKGWFIDAVV